MATGIESGTRRGETIREESMAVAAASASVVGAARGTSRNTDGTTTDAGSSSAMTSVDTVTPSWARRRLAARRGNRGRKEAGTPEGRSPTRGVWDAVAAQTQGLWVGRPYTGIRAVLGYASETNW